MSDTPFEPPKYTEEEKPLEKISSFSILANMISSPQKAFKDIQISYPILFPLLTISLLTALLVYQTFSNIDFQWYVEHMVQAQAGDLSPAEQDTTRSGFELMGKTGMSIAGALTGSLAIILTFVVLSVYFVVVSSFTNDGFQFKQWLSFVSWSSIPSLASILASFIVVFTSSGGQISPESINPLSLNALIFNMDPLNGLGSILATIDLPFFWTIGLMTIGYAQWTQSSYLKSFIIISLPSIIYFSIMFLIV